jgi:hypothetical protein
MPAIAAGVHGTKWCKGQQHMDYEGYFAPNGGASPSIGNPITAIGVQSITRLSAGLLQFQFLENFADVLGFSMSAMHGSGLNFVFELDATAANFKPGAGIITVRCLSAGVATDVPAVATNRLMYTFAMKLTGAGGNVG